MAEKLQTDMDGVFISGKAAALADEKRTVSARNSRI
jgi:hypothetical protein